MPDFDPFEKVGDELDLDLPEPEEVEGKGKKKRGGKQVEHWDRAQKLYQDRGFCYSRCDRYEPYMMWNPSTQRREVMGGHYRDLFGFLDALAFREIEKGVTGVQITSKKNLQSHIRSACTNDSGDRRNANRGVTLVKFLLAGNRFHVVGYEKVGRFWIPTIVDVDLDLVRRVQGGARLFLKELRVITLA